MKIRKLTIQGFKSFADRMTLLFDSPICGVVGPNGCGKSNVIDAIKWVMGEQSPRKLRGSAMADVVFNGSENRAPLGMAEVTIVFENDSQGVPSEYARLPEISVTRRLFRTGESEYLINKQLVRLRDVTDLFLGTGVGSKAYAIVEQDRVAMLVNARAEERRRVVEEAAGITKYKTRRAAAERKLAATEQNLARISDIVSEVGKRLGSLRRQARKAERYKRLRAEMQDIELHRMSARYLELIATGQFDQKQIGQLTDAADRLEADLQKAEADIELGRIELLDEDRRLSAAQGRLYELESQVQLAEQEIQHSDSERERLRLRAEEAVEERERLDREGERLVDLREELLRQSEDVLDESGNVEQLLNEISGRIERLGRVKQQAEEHEARERERLFAHRNKEVELRSNIDGARTRARDLGDELQRQRDERDQIQSSLNQALAGQEHRRQEAEQARLERDRLMDRLESSRADLEELEDQVRIAEAERNRVRDELSDKRSRLLSLQEVERSHAAAPEGVQQTLGEVEKQGEAGVLGLLSEALLVPEGLDRAVAALLGPRLQAILLRGAEPAKNLVTLVKAKGFGRVHVLDVDNITMQPELEARGSNVKLLVEQISLREDLDTLLRPLLAGVAITPDLPQAMALRQTGWAGAIVTTDGELLQRGGWVSVGTQDESATGALRLHRELHGLQQDLLLLESEMERAENRREVIGQRRDELDGMVDSMQHALQELALSLVEKEQALRGLADQQSRMRAELDRVSHRLERVEEQHQRNQTDMHQARALMQARGAEVAGCRLRAEAWSVEADRLDRSLRSMIDEMTEVRVRAASSRERREAYQRRIEETDATLVDMAQRRERLERNLERDQEEAVRRAASVESARELATRSAFEAMQLREGLEGDRQRYDNSAGRITEMEAATRENRKRLTELRDQQSKISQRQRGDEVALQNLRERAEERYQVSLESVLYDYHQSPLPGLAESERLAQVSKIIESMGEINLAAASEYESLEERHSFLTGQQDDLTHAVQQLRRAIIKIDRTTRLRFREAFASINQKFQQVFPRLFGGGQAHLELVDPDNILTTGIEIFAQPPGKNLQQVSLMSGGEKALTAISLIFSVFLIKPSPFCLLDEVDAPLDDANVGRFTDLLRDMSNLSQFIFISHNRNTMESADRLYGVTMQTPGVSKIVSVQLRAGGEPDLGAAA